MFHVSATGGLITPSACAWLLAIVFVPVAVSGMFCAACRLCVIAEGFCLVCPV